MISAAPTPINARTAITWSAESATSAPRLASPKIEMPVWRASLPEAVAERAEDEQQPGEHEQVRVDHPLQLRGGRIELGLHRGQGDVEDRVVEPDDDQAQ